MPSAQSSLLSHTQEDHLQQNTICVAVPSPLYSTFHYLLDSSNQNTDLPQGCRVMVPFGKQKLVGVVIEDADQDKNAFAKTKLKPIIQVLDYQPIIDQTLMSLCLWIADYYHHPIGEVIQQVLPTALRKGGDTKLATQTCYQLNSEKTHSEIEDLLKRATKQRKAWEVFQTNYMMRSDELKQHNISTATIKALIEKSLIIKTPLPAHELSINEETTASSPPQLNGEQSEAVDAISEAFGQFAPFLLEGVTGSGKTEVYLQAIERLLEQGRQALVLVPEIGLTPQTVGRFQKRFPNKTIAVIHSGLNDNQRKQSWLLAQHGIADILIGTRSASLTPMPRLGLIVIDEEHDASFKQQEGLRYHARDTAIKRAQLCDIPIVLGSATPSIESLYNAEHERYRLLTLKQRAAASKPTQIDLIDVRKQPLHEGLSETLIEQMQQTLARGEQAMVFINRRGYSPALICHDCGWTASCTFCDMKMTVHRTPPHLHCHHCDHQEAIPPHCLHCNSSNLEFIGTGTERTELALQQFFADTPIYRIDRDTTKQKNAFNDMLDAINTGEPAILVGTQMLAKGHHFANVTLVGIIDADSGLFSADFRSPERFGQLITQVAGRAGRESKQGKVLIQTHLPEHPLLNTLIAKNYGVYARNLLLERKQNQLPPFCQMTLIRANDTDPLKGQTLLQQANSFLASLCQQYDIPAHQISLWGPSQAPIAKTAGRYRWQLAIQTQSRKQRHWLLNQLIDWLQKQNLAKRVRWSIDVDALDLY